MKVIPDSLAPEEAWKILRAFPRLPIIAKPIAAALNHHLAESFIAMQDIPPGERSFMDGYAVRAEDLASIPAKLKLAGEVLMGEIPERGIEPGQTMAIPTGGFLPKGSDAVVMQEDTEIVNEFVLMKRKVQSGENVQRKGEDFRKGEVLFAASHRLRAQDLSALATLEAKQVRVYSMPEISILSTGNELIPLDAPAEPGRIRETNSLALLNAARNSGFRAEFQGIIKDEFASQQAALERALKTADVILISGGSSVGERDYTLDVIRSFPSHKIHFHGLSIRPGNPTIFASLDSRAIFGLPGQPVSSLIVFYLFVLPFLFHIAGEYVDFENFPENCFKAVSAKLETDLRPLKTKTDYVRLRLQRLTTDWVAHPVLGKSASLSTLARADGFCIVPPGENVIPAGASIRAFLFP